MPEFRQDPITGRWIILSEERSRRPSDFAGSQWVADGGACPFCPGKEVHTPPEVYVERETGSENGPGWTIRVVSNKYPALRMTEGTEPEIEGLFRKVGGLGAHEVIIESPSHVSELSTLSVETLTRVFRVYRHRILSLGADRRIRYVQLFKNHGPLAGATLEHGHTQLIASPLIPRRVAEKLAGFRKHLERVNRCILCDIVDQESKDGSRIIQESVNFLALAPFASRFPFETWIVPKHHQVRFEDAGEDALGELAGHFRSCLQRIRLRLDEPDYNLVLHTAPIGEPGMSDPFHWHLEILPRRARIAGFEWGTGFYINPTAPEQAAEILRTEI